jgi:hypothetical protein
MVRSAKLALVLLVLGLLLAACGNVHAGTEATDAATVTAPAMLAGAATSTVTTWRTFPANDFVHMQLADSGRVLAIPVQVPPENSECLRDFTARLTSFTLAAASLAITFAEPTSGPYADQCPLGPVKTVRITLPAPLDKRQVIVNNVGTFWATSATALTLCGNAGTPCTPVPTSPPSASCSDVSYGWAMAATGPPEHANYNAVGCDGQWLVLDVGWPGGAAGCDGPSCGTGSTVTHWFFRASAKGWIVIASSLTAGCTRIRQVAPQFPTVLCAKLPAVGPDAAAGGTTR